ncbi:hypothetical protein RhiirB3_450029 [Rhizophagus irregularis]|nr:hypothetical protein RhiirB3_450029 [Rhizophagus irregularis]
MSKKNARARQLSNIYKIQAEKHNSSQQLIIVTYLESTNDNNYQSKFSIEKFIELLKSELYKYTETKEYLQKKKAQDKSLKQICSLNSKVTKLHKKHISKVNSYGKKLSIVNNAKLKSVITKIIKENKKEFSPEFKLLTIYK